MDNLNEESDNEDEMTDEEMAALKKIYQ